MKVYVVLQINEYTEYEFCGVYGTREQAEKRISEIVSEHNVEFDSLYIEEIKVYQ